MVKKLRRKLGDDAADPRCIITEPRVGCRMAAGEEAGDGTSPGFQRTEATGADGVV